MTHVSQWLCTLLPSLGGLVPNYVPVLDILETSPHTSVLLRPAIGAQSTRQRTIFRPAAKLELNQRRAEPWNQPRERIRG